MADTNQLIEKKHFDFFVHWLTVKQYRPPLRSLSVVCPLPWMLHCLLSVFPVSTNGFSGGPKALACLICCCWQGRRGEDSMYHLICQMSNAIWSCCTNMDSIKACSLIESHSPSLKGVLFSSFLSNGKWSLLRNIFIMIRLALNYRVELSARLGSSLCLQSQSPSSSCLGAQFARQ